MLKANKSAQKYVVKMLSSVRCTLLDVGMLIFENFISRYENFKTRDSSSTRN